jgi:hypothetical protein
MIEEINTVSMGNYAEEPDSMVHFDQLTKDSKLFDRVYPEVCGYVVQPRLNTEAGQGVRIDRICFPSKQLIDLGWLHGPIGVEGKKSGRKIGKAISQAMDYACSAFEIRPGYHVLLEWIYLWPYDRIGGDLASVMMQHRIGTVCSYDYSPLIFKTESGFMLRWNGDTVDVRNMKAGCKRGSR